FIHRCRLAGLTPKVDTSFRLYHIGDYAYGLEEAAGEYLRRSRNIDYRIKRSEPRSAAEAVPPKLDSPFPNSNSPAAGSGGLPTSGSSPICCGCGTGGSTSTRTYRITAETM